MSIQIAEQYEENEQYDKAYEEYKKIYDKNPKDMNILERLGHLSMMLGNKQEAADYYSKILEFDVTNSMVYEQLMDIYQDIDRFKYYIHRGNLHSIEHKFEHAINDYKKALSHTQEEKDIITTRFVLAALYAQTGNSTKAIDEYLRLLDYSEIPSETYINLAKLYIAENAASSAINVLERAVAKGINSESIRETLADLYLKNNQANKAMEITQNELTKVKCMLDCGDDDKAYEILSSNKDKYQTNAKYHSLLAQYYFMKNKFDEALGEVEEFDKYEKNSPLTYQMRALIYENKKDDYNAHINWGKYNLLRGNKDIAINEYLNAYQMRDDDLNLLNSLAVLLEENGDKNHAMEIYERIAKLEPNNIKAIEKIANFRHDIGDYRTECDYLELWYESDKRNYPLIKRMAQIYEKLRNKPSAIEFYKKYLQSTTVPDYEVVKAHLAKLENTEMEMANEEGWLDKIMRFFNKD